jgi:hypothetical protein
LAAAIAASRRRKRGMFQTVAPLNAFLGGNGVSRIETVVARRRGHSGPGRPRDGAEYIPGMSVNFQVIVEPEDGVFVTYVPALDESGTKRG